MKSEVKKWSAVVREGYQILLRAEAEIEELLEWEGMRAYYRSLAEKCMAWAIDVHGERLRREFLELEDVHEKSLFRAQKYRFLMRCVWESDTHAAILCESYLLGQRGEPKNSYHRLSHVWNLSEGTVLPTAQVLRLFGKNLRPKDLPFLPDGIYPMGEELIFFKNPTQSAPFAMEKSPLQIACEGGEEGKRD